MTIENERIYIVGATGKIGSIVVSELVESGAHVTVFVRSPQKIRQADKVTIIQGDLNDLALFEQSIVGHSRLFLVAPEGRGMDKVKVSIAEKAYAAGVKQIVEISAKRQPSRNWGLLIPHEKAEKAIYGMPNRGTYVSLRPTNFMSNQFFTLSVITNENAIIDTADPDEPQEWISPNDIGRVAARILLDPVEKHGDAGYELIGDVKTPSERAAILSKVLGRTITYKQISAQELYDRFMQAGFGHDVSIFLATFQDPYAVVSRSLPILLGRPAETWEAWANRSKDAFFDN